MITAIQVSYHRLDLDPPFPAAWDPVPRRGFPVALVRVRDSSGMIGVGAGDPLRGLVDYHHLFVGQDPLDLDRHSAVLQNVAFLDGRPWPFELALWDLAGKLEATPVWKMLGGHDPRLRLYASFGTHRDVGQTVENAVAVCDRGFAAIKLRFGRSDLAADLEVLDAVRAAVGDEVAVMVDCNQGWRMPWDTSPPNTYSLARTTAAELAERDVYWIEEPLHRGDHAGMARLRQEVPIRVAGGEMTREMHEFDLLLNAGSLDVYQPDAAVTGGIGGLRRVAEKVHAAGHVFSPHTWGNGIGLMANAHLAAGTGGTPFLEFPLDPPEWTESRRDFLLSEPIVANGELALGDAPGWGIEIDEEMCDATAVQVAVY
ncbi:MAG: mandelate racemase/muconate lactonizing enzyme family protein [Acidimicrobiia bacterium]|nr:mandelate racemase/muconate lactonizing enzyme family protein [Acidimicrobiia bacterium]